MVETTKKVAIFEGEAMKVTMLMEMYPHQLMREVRDLAKLFWVDLPDGGEYYYKNYAEAWRPGKQYKHIIVTAEKWIHLAWQTEPISTDVVMSILLSFKNDALRVVMRFDESLPFAQVLYRELVDINRRLGYDGAIKIEGARR